MPAPWKIATDENFDGRILRGLLRRLPELDVLRLQDVLPEGTRDEDVLEWAAGDVRAVMTHDVSTLIGYAYARVETGRPMAGLVCVRADCPVGLAIEDLTVLLVAGDPSEVENQIVYVPF